MSFNSSIFIPAVVVTVVGSIVLSVLDINIPVAISFALGAVLSGIACSFTSTTSADTSSVIEETDSDSNSQTTTLYVGNLPYRANEASVRELFSEYGNVVSVRLLRDKQTGKRRGFGFVEMSSDDIQKTIDALNDFEFQERALKVRLANEK